MDSKVEITNLITPLINAFKLIGEEWTHQFEIGLNERLQKQAQSLFYTNTFLHRGEKVKFSDIYYPLTASYGSNVTKFDYLTDVFEKHNQIALIGTAGSGKTTILKYIYLKCFYQNFKIPILVELRHLNESADDFDKYIFGLILNKRIKPSIDTLVKTLKDGRFLFILDGYDELYTNKRYKILEKISLFIEKYESNNYLISSRPGSGIENSRYFYEFKMNELSHTDVEGFAIRMVSEKERQERVIEVIRAHESENLIPYLKNPLLLSMFLLSFENHPEIPTKKSTFYRNVFDTLYSRHDGINKNSFLRERLTNLKRDDFEDILSVFSFTNSSRVQYSFKEENLFDSLKVVKSYLGLNFDSEDMIRDLRTSISILVLDGLDYRFPHKSLQEYFTARFISSLPKEKKIRAYEKIATIVKGYKTQELIYFWSMCLELDNYDFIDLYILPRIREFALAISSKNSEENIFQFFQLHGAILEEVKIKRKVWRILVDGSSLIYQLNCLLNIFTLKDVSLFIEKNCSTELDLLLYDVDLNINTDKFYYSSDVRDMFINNGFCKVLDSIVERLNEKILYFEGIIKGKSSSVDDVLGY
ncbi:NACHT domain-containing protein [Fibrella sp. ES10-3-2-2]|nr:hypothetical protein A6C57_01015 [Fibrella sp. ES10-3-2-2]